jgi:transcription initiation factor TFIID subunit 13
MEPRARAGRHKSGLNFGTELTSLLYAYGAPTHPDLVKPLGSSSRQYIANPKTPNTTHPPTPFTQAFPETLRVLDEILTDFIIETCHNAVSIAAYSGRAKLKLSDFDFVLRKDAIKLGRVQEMLKKKREIEYQRRAFHASEGTQGSKLAVGDLVNLGEVVGEEGTGKGKGRGRGRRKKRDREEAEGETVANGERSEKTPGGLSEGDVEGRAAKRAKSDAD